MNMIGGTHLWKAKGEYMVAMRRRSYIMLVAAQTRLSLPKHAKGREAGPGKQAEICIRLPASPRFTLDRTGGYFTGPPYCNTGPRYTGHAAAVPM